MYFYKINEAEPKYQNLHQLLPRTGPFCMARLFYLPAGKAPAQPRKILVAYPRIPGQSHDLEPGDGNTIDDH